jgi:hypothetical protein
VKRARLLALAATLVLASACTSTYASEGTTGTTLENGWKASDVEAMRTTLRANNHFTAQPYLTQECIIGGILTEFSPAQVRGDISPSVEREIQSIMEIC